MKFRRFLTLITVVFSVTLLAAFTIPYANKTAVKIVVYKVNYDAMSNKVTATEKLEVSADMVQRDVNGKITSVNKEAILGQMPMAMRMQSLTNQRTAGAATYALISVSMDSKLAITSDQVLIDYLQKGFDSFSKHSFSGSDFSVSGKSWNCSGPSCNAMVPAGVEMFVWEE